MWSPRARVRDVRYGIREWGVSEIPIRDLNETTCMGEWRLRDADGGVCQTPPPEEITEMPRAEIERRGEERGASGERAAASIAPTHDAVHMP